MMFGLKVHHSDLSDLLYMCPDALEFALFPGDMDGAWADKARFDGPIVFHMPEKLMDGSLVDLASPDAGTRKEAIDILKRTIDIAVKMNVQGLVCHPGGVRRKPMPVDVSPLLDSMRELQDYASGNVSLLLENMPDIYWYKGELFCSCLFKREGEIVDILHTLGLGLCMDICHAKLYCNASGDDFLSYLKALKPLIRHIHISDARGTSDEGVQIGEGEIDFKVLQHVLGDMDVIVVPEILEGHRDKGAGFKVAAGRLRKFGYFNGPHKR